MIKFIYYRMFCTMLGSRSFVKKDGESKTYILIKGDQRGQLATKLIEDGYVEEWPLNPEDY